VPDLVLRLGIVAIVVVVALALARLSRPWQDSAHPALSIPPGDLPAGVVLFTSTDCDQCAAARAVLKKAAVEYREVTWELEAVRFEEYGVQGVPLLAIVESNGRQSLLTAGVPTRGSLRAVRRRAHQA
jgi:glutaredoxin